MEKATVSLSFFLSMKPTLEYIERKFKEYNRQMFGGKLPMLPIQLSKARTFIGAIAFKKRRTTFGKIEKYDFRLRISTQFDLPEQEIEDTIIHEMIHYYIGVNQLNDDAPHGTLFRKMMNDINARYGRHLNISHQSTPEEKEQNKDMRKRWHVIAIVVFHDGRIGVKVLPRIVPRITNYYNKVLTVPNVKSIELYMHNDPYFNAFPNSSALNVTFRDETEVRSHLIGAERMQCIGDRIIRNQ